MKKTLIIFLAFMLNLFSAFAQTASTGNNTIVEGPPIQAREYHDVSVKALFAIEVEDKTDKDDSPAYFFIFYAKGSVAETGYIKKKLWLPFEVESRLRFNRVGKSGFPKADLRLATLKTKFGRINYTLPGFKHMEFGVRRADTYNGAALFKLNIKNKDNSDSKVQASLTLGTGIGAMHATRSFDVMDGDGESVASINQTLVSDLDANFSLSFLIAGGDLVFGLGAGTEYIGKLDSDFADSYLWQVSAGSSLKAFPSRKLKTFSLEANYLFDTDFRECDYENDITWNHAVTIGAGIKF